MQNIFVGNLAATMSEEALRAIFEPFGQVSSVTLVVDRDTGAPRGFAFVEMNTESAGKQAIAATNGMVVQDCPINVNEARPKKPHADSSRDGMREHRRHRY
jgi:RNA recognition motif-containing protein